MIKLREFFSKDGAVLNRLRNDRSALAKMNAVYRSEESLSDTNRWAERQQQSLIFRIICSNEDDCLGFIKAGKTQFGDLGRVFYEIGIALTKESRGKGIGAQAVQAFLKEIPAGPVISRVISRNQASASIFKKNGFVTAGRLCGVVERHSDNENCTDLDFYILENNKMGVPIK